MKFDFAFPADAVFGLDRAKELPRLLLERGWSHPAIVVDAAVASTPAAREVIDHLGIELSRTPFVFEADTRNEPSYDYLDECTAHLRGVNPDCLVGIGGGSAMDLCKGIAVLLTNPGRGIDYRGMDRVKEPGIPCVLVPTTAGTGSETTFTAVFVDLESRTKLGINGRHMTPRLAVLDPALTASCPHSVAVGAGLDSVVHSLEAYMTCGSHPIVHSIAREALSHLFHAFPAAVGEPSDPDARLEMLLGAYLAGITLRYSGGGVAGALSYPLGAEFQVPHGLAGGLLVPAIVRLNVDGGYRGFDDLEAALVLSGGAGSETGPAAFPDRVARLFADIRAPDSLARFSVRRSHIPHIVEQSITQRSAVLSANPVPADDAYLTSVLESVIPE